MRFFKSLLVSFVICHLSISLALASESALSLSPAIYESIIDRGGYVKTEVFLTNLTNFPLPIKGWATAFLSTEQIPSISQSNYDASSWFKLEPADFILQPGERKKIILTITAPRSSEPGGHYATVFWQPLIPEGVLTKPSMLARVGLMALLIVPGDLREQVLPPELIHPRWLTFGPLPLSLKFTNTGNIHSTISGEIKITNLFKQPIDTIPVSPTTLLPGTDKTLTLSWDHRLGIGPYYLESKLTYGAANTQLSVPLKVVWYFPWPLILSSILLLTFLYKIIILNTDRVKLAWRVITGQLQEKDIKNAQVASQQKNTQKDISRDAHPHSRRRSH